MRQILPVPNPVESYWQSERHELNKVRTTPTLPGECDIVIIGSGLAGIATAYHLLHQNPQPPNILILEARELCSGATARNGGHCKIKTATLIGALPRLGPVGVDGLQAYVLDIIEGLKEIVEDEGLDCEFELRRSFEVETNSETSKKLKQVYDQSRREGQKWTRNTAYVDGRYAQQVTSIKDATSAFSVPVCSFWPYKFVTQLLARLLDRFPQCLNVQTTTPVESVTTDGNINLVRTSRGTIKSGKVVFATNAYTAGLLPQFKDVIVPFRGMATHLVPKLPVHPHLSHTYNIDFGPDKGVDYLNPRPDGGIVVGGGKWRYQDNCDLWYNNFDDSVPFSADVQEYWDGYMQRTFLGWESSESKVDKVWVGIMGVTPDGYPHVGRVLGTKNQWTLAGFNGGGMGLILTASKAVARMVRDDVEFDIVAKEYGVPQFFGTSHERMRHSGDASMTRRK